MKKFYYCDLCKRIFETNGHGGPLTCCGQPLRELTANTTDAATEKHVPAVKRTGNTLEVVVGSVEHPMTPEHYITMIVVEQGEKTWRVDLTSSDKPAATFEIGDGPATVYEFCNLHGLWKADVE